MQQFLWLNRTELDTIIALGWIALAIGIGVGIHRLASFFIDRWATRTNSVLLATIARRTRRPAAYIVPLLCLLITLPNLVLPARWTQIALHVTGLMTIAAIAWAIHAVVRMYGDIALAQHRLDIDDNLLARQLGTRVNILTRVIVTLVWLFAVGMMLMTFPEIRTIGTTVLASAGVAGLVAGLAARPLFENLIAGIQLAFTQPIRLDDVVIINGQYGRIEDITSTYVIVQIWDLRRMVVPLTWFIQNPFENWTRRTANLIGEVHVITDWTVNVDGVRAKVPEIVKRSPLWDGRVQNCQVVDATASGVDIRVLVSAKNASELWDLRCFVREAIVAYLRDEQPDALPRRRLSTLGSPEGAASKDGNA